MRPHYPTYCLTPESSEKLEQLADFFIESAEGLFSEELQNIDRFLKGAEDDPPDRDDHHLRMTPRPRYLLELVNFAVLDRINREAFNRTRETLIIMPDCLSLHNPDCEKSDSKRGDVCRLCTDNCRAHEIVKLAARYRARALFSKRKLSDQLEYHADRSKSLGVIGIACVMMLAEGMRTAADLGIPARGVLLEGCGCEHWNDTPFASGISVARVEEILEEKYGS